MKKLVTITLCWLGLTSSGWSTIPVIDYTSIAHDLVSEVKNYAQFVQQTVNQVTQITNQGTQILNQVTALKRFGDPQTYVNMLHLEDFTSSVSNLVQGVGNTIYQFRSTANGVQALGYTANGLYSNLTNLPDRFGNPVQYQNDAFRKFQTVNQMYDSYDLGLQDYNRQMASLQRQLSDALSRLNGTSTQMEADKYRGQIQAIQAEMEALHGRTVIKGQQLSVQHSMNQNDAARVEEARRQQMVQERVEDLNRMSRTAESWVYGGDDQNQGGQLP